MFGLPKDASVELVHIGLFLDIGVILLAFILFRFARLLGGLLEMVHKPPVEGWLKIASWLLILTFALPHYIAVAVLYPNRLSNPEVGFWLLIFRAVSFFGLFAAVILALVPCILYYRWTSE